MGQNRRDDGIPLLGRQPLEDRLGGVHALPVLGAGAPPRQVLVGHRVRDVARHRTPVRQPLELPGIAPRRGHVARNGGGRAPHDEPPYRDAREESARERVAPFLPRPGGGGGGGGLPSLVLLQLMRLLLLLLPLEQLPSVGTLHELVHEAVSDGFVIGNGVPEDVDGLRDAGGAIKRCS